MKNKHKGSSFDDFLKEEGLFEECHTEAVKRVIAFQHSTMSECEVNLMSEPFDSKELDCGSFLLTSSSK